MNERKKLAIIDGKSVFYRGYYAMGSLSTTDGTPTGGVYGFAAMALELLKRLQPDYVCVAWDKPKTNIRRRLAIYSEYKAGRKPAPPDFYAQIPILHELLEAFGWPLYEIDDYEADDIMYGLSKQAERQGIETMLISSDLDMLQAVGEHTHMYALKKGFSNIERFDVAAFEAKYGISCAQFLDLKALKGDGSDNIPGVPGIGEKTALELLRTYKSLDGIYDNLWNIKESVRKKLEAGKESALMSKQVAQLFDDAPIELDLVKMDIRDLDTERLRVILKRLEFKSLLRILPEHMRVDDSTKSVDGAVSSRPKIEKRKIVVYTHQKTLTQGLQTSGADIVVYAQIKEDSLKALAIDDKTTTYVFDFAHGFHSGKQLKRFFANISVTGYDLKTLLKLLLNNDVEIATVRHDCLLAEFVINSLNRDNSMVQLAEDKLNVSLTDQDLDILSNHDNATPIIDVLRAVATIQAEEMSELPTLINVVETIDNPLVPVLARIENTGILLDVSFFETLSTRLRSVISDTEQIIYGLSDEEFNIASPGQLSEILFNKLKLPTMGVKKGKTGNYSTASEVLIKLKPTYPIVGYIETYREYTKLLSTYVEPLPRMVDASSRIHTTFNMTVAQTGRLSSVDPNLQNIPVRTEIGKFIREGFVAGTGNVFVNADYSQFELRVAAAMSGDTGMIDAFNNDRDIHTETAALINGVSSELVTKEMRYAAKAVNFGILYGQGVHGLSTGAGISYEEAKKFIDRYFEVRPKLKGMIDAFRLQAHDKGYVESLLGRRRPTPDVKSNNFIVREAAYRAAVNMPIQGTAADLTKLAMIRLEEKLPLDAKQVLQIHDSIMVECKEEDAEKVGAIMKETMEQVYPELGVNLRVDVSIGKNWGEL